MSGNVKIAIVVAMADNRVIGCDNGLPWHLPADLRYFRQVTHGKPVLMGRKTHESIGRPLPERTNIVVTRDRSYEAPGCIVVHSIESALKAAGDHEEVMVIGGTDFYRQLLPTADRIYLTRVHAEFEGDARFPELDECEWREIERMDCASDEKNPWPYSFIRLERISRHDPV
ncbi:MAG: dihydrofolate reductase [Gammaproteobacteria bacterium]